MNKDRSFTGAVSESKTQSLVDVQATLLAGKRQLFPSQCRIEKQQNLSGATHERHQEEAADTFEILLQKWIEADRELESGGYGGRASSGKRQSC